MFSWVTQQLETISQAVAPPPTDPPSLFVHCCCRGEEQAAMEAAYQFATTAVDHRPMSMVIVHAGKQQTALHVACQYGLSRVMDYLLSSSSSNDTLHEIIHVRDALGNTPLHVAAAATGATVAEKDAIVGLVQRLVTELQASPVVKNYAQQTPYDVAVLDRVRQYLLPIQLQRETQDALDNGGVGLPPGVDLGGLRINYSNSTLGPPPMGMGGPPVMMPPPQQVQEQPSAPSVFDTPTAAHKSPAITDVSGSMPPPALSDSSQPTPVIPHQPVIGAAVDQPAFPAPPSSGGSSNNGEYATRGYSSAHIYNPKGKRVMKPDGFHSSSSDKRLQEKYGHAQAFPSSGHMPPPPPRSGHSPVVSGNGSGTSGDTSQASPSPSGPNPFAGGSSVFAIGGARVGLQRYVPVDPMTGRPLPQPQQPPYAAVPAPASAPYSSPPTPATMFIPGAVATPGQFQMQPAAAATFMPPSTAAATPSSAGLSTPSPGSGSFFPAPPKRSDAISPRAQSLSGFPSPPTASASFSSPPRHAGALNTGTSTATTSSSPFTAAPSIVSTASGTASSFLSPPPGASKFPAPPSSSAVSKFPAPPVPSASASSLFASPPPPGRVTSAPAASANVANTMDASSAPQPVPPVQEEPALKAVVAAPDMFLTPQPTMTLPQQSTTALFSSPVQVAADESVAVVPVASSFEGDVGPGDSDAARGLLPQAPKSGESVKSAAELFGSPAGGFTDAIEPEAASLPTMVEMIVVNQAPKSGESIKSAADLFGAPTLDTSNAADAASHVPSKGTEHPVIFELVDDAACSASASVDFDPAAAISDEACGAIVLISENLEQDGQLPDTKVAQTRDAESPSKLLNDESEMLQEIPLSPSQDDE